MRSKNVILLFALFAVAFSFDLSSFVELGEIKNDPIGKSLIETISMSLEKTQGGKVENIQNLLQDLLVKLMNDQKASDKAWGKERTRLDNRIRALVTQVSNLKVEVSNLKKLRASTRVKKARSIRNVAQYKSQLAADHSALNTLTIKRRQDKANYQASNREHSAIIGAIESVIASLNKLRGSIAANKPSHVKAIAEERRDLKLAFTEIVGEQDAIAFAELATDADQSALARLIALLNNILRNTRKSLTDDQAYEAESRSTYRRLKVTLQKDISVLTKTIAKQQANLATYTRKINELTVTINIRLALLKSRQAELKQVRAERLSKENRYNTDKKHRNHENKIIRKLQAIVTDRLARMSSFLKTSTN